MTHQQNSESPELIIVQGSQPQDEVENGETGPRESVEQPAKVMRIGTMIKQLLEEVRHAPLDEKSRGRLAEIYDTSVTEIASSLSPDLKEELGRLTPPFDDNDIPSEAELRIAQAQLVGWLEGIFHGIQATLFAQQAAARAQITGVERRGLPRPQGDGSDGSQADPDDRPGNYL